MYRDDEGTAITARRWLSLAAVGGDDDMFSSDFTAAELQVRNALNEAHTKLVLQRAWATHLI